MKAEVDMEFEEQGVSLLEYVNIIRRRKRLVAIAFGAVVALGVAVAFLWPATYRSESIILIKGQDVPQNLVQTTITSYAQQRIEEIKQRIMTTSNIMSIVEQFGLYTPKELERKTRTEITADFRKAVSILPISADIVDPQSGRPREAVIAFSLAFDGENPSKVRAVASELTDLYLNENLRERTEQTKSTAAFLKSESEVLLVRVEELEGKIAEFKEANKGGLPEFQSYNIGVVERTEEKIRLLEFDLGQHEKRRIKLEGEMAIVSPTAPVMLPSGEQVMGEADRLKALESEYRKKSAVYREDHPDLIRLKRSIEDLLASGVQGVRYQDKAKQLSTERDRLEELKSKYTEDHPEIVAAERVIKQLETELSSAIRNEAEVAPDNPAYLILSNQLDSVLKDIKGNTALREQLLKKLEVYRAYVSRGPQLEKELIALNRELQTTQAKYNEIRSKLLHAELAQNLESEQKGERFTLIQPPELPKDPISPNRPALVFLSLILAAVVGVATAIIRDSIDGGIYTVKDVVKLTGATPLVVVGYMETDDEAKKHNSKRVLLVAGALVAAIIGLMLFHYFVKPLDVTWFILMRRLGLG